MSAGRTAGIAVLGATVFACSQQSRPAASAADTMALCPRGEPEALLLGRVVDQHGAPVSSAEVTILWSSSVRKSNACGTVISGVSPNIVTGANGEFSTRLPRLTVNIRIRHDDEPAPAGDTAEGQPDGGVDGYVYDSVELDLDLRAGEQFRLEALLRKRPCHLQVSGDQEECLATY